MTDSKRADTPRDHRSAHAYPHSRGNGMGHKIRRDKGDEYSGERAKDFDVELLDDHWQYKNAFGDWVRCRRPDKYNPGRRKGERRGEK